MQKIRKNKNKGLKIIGDCVHPYLVPDFNGNASSILPLNVTVRFGLRYILPSC